MKLRTLLLTLSLSGLAPGTALFAPAQEPAIKVTSLLHPDGSRTDSQTNLAEGTMDEKTYDAAGKLIRRMVYKLDEQRQPTEGAAYSAQGKILYRFVFTRDAFGRISEERDFSVDGKPVRRLVYHYNSEGQLIKMDGFDGQGNPLPAAANAGRPASSGSSQKKSSRRTR